MRIGSLLDWEQAIRLRETYRQGHQKVVLTNGCFDLLHVGHIRLLEAARSLGNVLIVGLNSDASVRRLKGPGRPIIAAPERAEILVALRAIDPVVVFEDDTADRLVGELTPDVYVKGGDYSLENLPEARVVEAQGGQVVLLPYTPERSTSRLLALSDSVLCPQGSGIISCQKRRW